MGTTPDDLKSFHYTPSPRLTRAEFSNFSLDDFFWSWLDIRDRQLVNDAIQRGLADVEARRYEPADLAMEKIRVDFGFPKE